MSWTLIFLSAVILNFVVKLFLISRQMRFVALHRDRVPEFFSDQIPLSSHQKAADYTIAKQKLNLVSLVIETTILLALTLLGGIDWISQQVSVLLGHSPYVAAIALMLAVNILSSLIDLPLSWYSQFVVEERFGFNKMTTKLFLTDLLKSTLVGALIGIPFLWGLLWLMTQMGTHWWLWAWAAMIGFSLLMQWIYPTWIAPLFNRFEPIADASLQEKIMNLAQRCEFTLKGIFVMDGSKRSGHGNAYFSGFGANKRIVFYDTLLSRLTPEEVEAVLAHELGHYKLKHIFKMLAVAVIMALVQFAILGYLKEHTWFYQQLGVNPSMNPVIANAQALLLFMLVMPLMTFFLTPLSSMFSRQHEYEADAFAAQHSDPQRLISALVKMTDDNASTLTPDPWYSRMYYSHPPALERILHLQSLKQTV